jgi:hypothetical protein
VTDSSGNALERLIGVLRSPRVTLTHAIAHPRSLDLAILILIVSASCSAGFLLTDVGKLAALDQQVRQLESFGAHVDDDTYAQMRRWVPYRPAISAAVIVLGWPAAWVALAGIIKTIADRVGAARGTYAQVLTVVVHASAVFALQSVIAAPLNYTRESLGGATTLSLIMPSFGESTFGARLLGAVDLFVLWWTLLVALGLGILYGVRTVPIARWLLGTYAAGACALALTQALRGGI